jgi:ribosomal protein S18 acetylase RimI-like enzyme
MDLQTIEIRAAVSADVDAVLALWRDADAAPSVTDDVRSVRRLLERDPEALLLATDGDRIVGTLIAGWDGWRANMYRLAVHPDARRHGVARALVEAAHVRFAEVGAVRCGAIVIDGRAPAVGFWTAAGYQPDATVTRFVVNLPRTLGSS